MPAGGATRGTTRHGARPPGLRRCAILFEHGPDSPVVTDEEAARFPSSAAPDKTTAMTECRNSDAAYLGDRGLALLPRALRTARASAWRKPCAAANSRCAPDATERAVERR